MIISQGIDVKKLYSPEPEIVSRQFVGFVPILNSEELPEDKAKQRAVECIFSVELSSVPSRVIA